MARSDAAFVESATVLCIEIPPLRERPNDAAVFATRVLAANAPGARFDEAAEDWLRKYAWPGGLAELETLVEGTIFFAEGGAIIKLEDLQRHHSQLGEAASGPRRAHARRAAAELLARQDSEELTLPEIIEAVEKEVIDRGLRRVGGNRTVAARQLGISRSNLIAKIRKYGID